MDVPRANSCRGFVDGRQSQLLGNNVASNSIRVDRFTAPVLAADMGAAQFRTLLADIDRGSRGRQAAAFLGPHPTPPAADCIQTEPPMSLPTPSRRTFLKIPPSPWRHMPFPPVRGRRSPAPTGRARRRRRSERRGKDISRDSPGAGGARSSRCATSTRPCSTPRRPRSGAG